MLLFLYTKIMKKRAIYVDTSVIGGCCDQEFQEWSNGILKDFQTGTFKLLLSELIDAEIEDAPDEVKKVTGNSGSARTRSYRLLLNPSSWPRHISNIVS